MLVPCWHSFKWQCKCSIIIDQSRVPERQCCESLRSREGRDGMTGRDGLPEQLGAPGRDRQKEEHGTEGPQEAPGPMGP